MGAKVRKKGSLTTSIDLTNLENYQRVLKEIGGGDILRRAAELLQRKAINAMKKQYLNSASNRIDNNRSRKAKAGQDSIVNRLFADVPAPLNKGNKTVEFKFWAGYGALSGSLPHLRWQEEGTKGMVDQQPYAVTKKKPGNKGRSHILGPLTKVEARNRPEKPSNLKLYSGSIKGRGGRFESVSQFKETLEVRHPALKPRGFIAAGNFLIKSQGDRIVTDFIRNEINKRTK